LKNALLSGIPFFWCTHQDWNSHGTQGERPYGHPRESNRDTNDYGNDQLAHGQILRPYGTFGHGC